MAFWGSRSGVRLRRSLEGESLDGRRLVTEWYIVRRHLLEFFREVFYVLGCECPALRANERSRGVQMEAVNEEINDSSEIGYVGVACSGHVCANIVVGRYIWLEWHAWGLMLLLRLLFQVFMV